MDAFVDWLRCHPAIPAVPGQVAWLWPLCESLHFLGLSMLIGAAGFFDLSSWACSRSVPISSGLEARSLGQRRAVVNLVTGLVFLISQPEQYATNVSMWLKMLFLLVAGVNALVFERLYATRLADAGTAWPTRRWRQR